MQRVENETMLGKIYKITNLINNKVYIGQTKQSLQERWYKHCQKHCDKHHFHMPIKQAIFKYGKEHFTIELLEECDVCLLNERECYWIQFYDSYTNGYNCTKGGQDCATRPTALSKEQEQELIKLKQSGLSSSQLARKYNIDKTTVSNIFKRHGLKMPHNKNLKEQINIKEFIQYLKVNNPTLKEIMNKYNICKCSVYNLLKRNNIEYNFSTSVHPQ